MPESRRKPIQIVDARLRDGRVRRLQVHVRVAPRGTAPTNTTAPMNTESMQRLVEHEIGAIVLLRADRVRHQRHRTDVQDLREREHDEPDVAGRR